MCVRNKAQRACLITDTTSNCQDTLSVGRASPSRLSQIGQGVLSSMIQKGNRLGVDPGPCRQMGFVLERVDKVVSRRGFRDSPGGRGPETGIIAC
jgi:predicted Zn-ribbon and HTH transcriptional regulator